MLSDSSSDDSEADSSREDEEEKKEASPPVGGEKKRKASPTGEAKGSKKGRTLPPDYSTNADDGEEEWPPRAKPLAKSYISGYQNNPWRFICRTKSLNSEYNPAARPRTGSTLQQAAPWILRT